MRWHACAALYEEMGSSPSTIPPSPAALQSLRGHAGSASMAPPPGPAASASSQPGAARPAAQAPLGTALVAASIPTSPAHIQPSTLDPKALLNDAMIIFQHKSGWQPLDRNAFRALLQERQVQLVNKAAAKLVNPVCDITYILWPRDEGADMGLHACISAYHADGGVLQIVRSEAETLGRWLPPPS